MVFEVSLIILVITLITMLIRVFLILPITTHYVRKNWADYLLLWVSIITGFGVCYSVIIIDQKLSGIVMAVLLVAMITLIWKGVEK